jgi:hypothetical protein
MLNQSNMRDFFVFHIVEVHEKHLLPLITLSKIHGYPSLHMNFCSSVLSNSNVFGSGWSHANRPAT